ncbi:Pre-mRNA-splicing factor CEF1, putative [Babesia ovata]|uniref:Pre-mRNA-splicing factor CEF1, putative n=1 Tax=Babesia ovata TaxID=189622 RepID=A0A2H6KD08_9APIC|nr:Pre-mRNA-splicing factor CEF1, putative [Babesia ovata]GBE60849.1 Pre-mRNA-splicing factor CEF1, putative [Babesia ovata]
MSYIDERGNRGESYDGDFHNAYRSMFAPKPGSIWRKHSRQRSERDRSQNRLEHVQGPSSDGVDGRWPGEVDNNPDSRPTNYRSISTPSGGYGGRLWSDDVTRSYNTAGSPNGSLPRRHKLSFSSNISGDQARNRYAKSHNFNFTYGREGRGGNFVGDYPFDSSDESSAPTTANGGKRYIGVRKKPVVSESSDGCFTSRDFATWLPNRGGGDSHSQHLSNAAYSTPRSDTGSSTNASNMTTRISTQIKLGFQKVKSFLSNAFQKIKDHLTPICSGDHWRSRRTNRTDIKVERTNEPLLECDTYSRSFEEGR